MTEQWDGRPQNPERDGWHWLRSKITGASRPEKWCADVANWRSGPALNYMYLNAEYIGPCLLPAEVEAERERLREVLRDCVETWRPLLADADLTAHENPAYLTLMRADLALGEDRA